MTDPATQAAARAEIAPKALFNLPAPAKINLFLHITGRRNDGYHLLQSAFCLLDLHDSLDISATENGIISREDVWEQIVKEVNNSVVAGQKPLPETLPEDDLCTRAARLLRQYSGVRGQSKGAHIRLTKRIPTQAGLGGGSSDAATTLLALNHLWGLHYPLATLQILGAQLGADVPFFIGGRNAWVEGVGEQLTPLQLPRLEVLLLKPSQGVATADVFKHPDLQRNCTKVATTDFVAQPLAFGVNVMQPIAEQLCPEIREGLAWLNATGFGPHPARMSGSGSSVFAARLAGGEQPLAIDSMEAYLTKMPVGAQVFRCTSLPQHPVHSLLGLQI